MKKNLFLVPLLAIALLAGCDNKKTPQSESVIESSESFSDSSSNSSSSSSESESSESSSSEEIITGEEASFTFKTGTGDSTWPSGGLGDGNHIETFMNKLNENKTLFTNITQEKVQFASNNEFKTMWIGNADGSGFVEFTTSVTVKKIEVEVQTYFKYDSYNKIMRFDGSTVFSVQDKQIDLSTEEVVESSEVKKQAFTFPEGLKKFTLSSNGGRTFLNKLTITYVE